MSYADKTLTCRDCGAEFVFTAGEQSFYAQKGFTNEPTRCSACRQARKASSAGSGASGGYRGYADRSYGGESRTGQSAGARELHTVPCASCGKDAQVPFIPRGSKPVYCDECFQKQRRSAVRY